jgi:hypothetical protein
MELVDLKDLFATNKNPIIEVVTFPCAKILVIDDFYENPDDIVSFVKQSPAFRYDTKPKLEGNGDAFIDARSQFVNIQDDELDFAKLQEELIEKVFRYAVDYKELQHHFSFNLFQPLTHIESKYQMPPHYDATEINFTPTMASLIYLDEMDGHGTAFYYDSALGVNHDGNFDGKHGLIDVDKWYASREVVNAKYNRCLVYESQNVHGQYIHDYDKLTDTRITQVMFAEIKGLATR